MTTRAMLAALAAILLASALAGAVPAPTHAAAAAAVSDTPVPTWGTNGPVNAIAVSGSVAYLGGNFDYVGPFTGSFARFDAATGAAASSTPVLPNGLVEAVAPDGAGGWYLGGNFDEIGGVARTKLAHVLADGTVDPSWTPSVNGIVNSLAVSGSTVYVGGAFSSVDGTTRHCAAALSATDGTVLPFDPDLNSSVFAIAVDGATVYMGGEFSTVNGGAATRHDLAAFVAGTGEVAAFDPNVGGPVNAVAVAGGLVYAGGRFTSVNGGTDRRNLASFTVDGTATSWDPAVDDAVNALAVSRSTIYAGGDFTGANVGQPTAAVRNHLAAFDTAGRVTAWDPDVDQTVRGLYVSGSTVYAGGSFTHANGSTEVSRLAAFDSSGALVTTWGGSADGDVFALAGAGSQVAAGGTFHSVGGVIRHDLAAIDLTSGQASSWNPDADGVVSSLAVSGSTVYAGGNFFHVNGTTARRGLAGFGASTGTATSFDAGLDGFVSALAVAGSTVYAGGKFSHVNGTTVRNNLAAFDATGAATAFDPNVGDSVHGVTSLAVAGGVVYAAGGFSTVNTNTTRNRVAAFDAATGGVDAFDPNLNGFVAFAVAVSGTTVYVGGVFTDVNGGTPRHYLAAFDANGDATSFDPNLDNEAATVAVSGSTVYAGGFFTHANGGTSRPQLASFDATGALTDWNPAPNAFVNTLAVAPDGSVLAGGNFSSFGTTHQRFFAVFPPTGAPPAGGGTANVVTSLNVPGTVPVSASAGAPFDVRLHVTNSGTAAAPNARATLRLPNGFTLVGPPSPASLGTLAPGADTTVTWHVRGPSACADTSAAIAADVDWDGAQTTPGASVSHPTIVHGTCARVFGVLSGTDFGGWRALDGTTVELCAPDLTGCRSTTTDASGSYSFLGLAPGSSFRVVAHGAGSFTSPATKTSAAFTVGFAEDRRQDFGWDAFTPLPPGATVTGPGVVRVVGGLATIYWGAASVGLIPEGCGGGASAVSTTATISGPGGFTTSTTTPGAGFTIPALAPAHGYMTVDAAVTCDDGSVHHHPFDIYVDPSGLVRDTAGGPVAGATVTLFRDEGAPVGVAAVPDGSAVMSAANRANPDTTDANGHFGWDVMPGSYVVRAEKAGCHAPGDAATPYVESATLSVPPAVTDLVLTLECPAAAAAPAAAPPAPAQHASGGGGSGSAAAPTAVTAPAPAAVPAAAPAAPALARHGATRALRIRRIRGSWILTAAVDVDQPATLRVTLVRRDGTRVRLRAGSVVGRIRSGKDRADVVAAVGRGATGLTLRLGPRGVVPGRSYRLTVVATGLGGTSSRLVLAATA